jgi:hypothetical protein
MLKKKFGPLFKELKNFLPQKLSALKNMDLGTYGGSRILKALKQHTPDPEHWIIEVHKS